MHHWRFVSIWNPDLVQRFYEWTEVIITKKMLNTNHQYLCIYLDNLYSGPSYNKLQTSGKDSAQFLCRTWIQASKWLSWGVAVVVLSLGRVVNYQFLRSSRCRKQLLFLLCFTLSLLCFHVTISLLWFIAKDQSILDPFVAIVGSFGHLQSRSLLSSSPGLFAALWNRNGGKKRHWWLPSN